MTLLFPETRCPKKNSNTVASLVFEFLRRRKCSFDELIVFTDNAATQNKNIYLCSILSMIAVKEMFGCQSVVTRNSDMTAGLVH